MEQYSNRDAYINGFYNNFIAQASEVDEENPNKYAWMCGWSDKHNQYKRFEVLSQIGIKNRDAVLDIGCGGGEFVGFCKENKLRIKYTGIDINPFYLEIARARFPKYTFITSNGWDLTSMDYDWAVASGIFTYESNTTQMLWYVGFVMERLARKGFAFNLLHNNPHEGLVQYNPDVILVALRERFSEYKIEIVQGYLPDDFTVYVKK